MTDNNGSGTIDIEKLLEQREATHGDHKRVYSLVWGLWEETIETADFKKLKQWQKVELCMVLLKIGRFISNPLHGDSVSDIIGYATLMSDNHGDGYEKKRNKED